jgi:hypothetical protein
MPSVCCHCVLPAQPRSAVLLLLLWWFSVDFGAAFLQKLLAWRRATLHMLYDNLNLLHDIMACSLCTTRAGSILFYAGLWLGSRHVYARGFVVWVLVCGWVGV